MAKRTTVEEPQQTQQDDVSAAALDKPMRGSMKIIKNFVATQKKSFPTKELTSRTPLLGLPVTRITLRLEKDHELYDGRIGNPKLLPTYGMVLGALEAGVPEPVIVRYAENNVLEIVSGRRRFMACVLAEHLRQHDKELKKAHPEPVLVECKLIKNLGPAATRSLILRSNSNRVDTPVLEQAAYLSDVLAKKGGNATVQELATAMGTSTSTINNLLRINSLPEEIIEAIRNDTISASAALRLTSLEGKKQLSLFKKLQKLGMLTCGNVENAVRAEKTKKDGEEATIIHRPSRKELRGFIERGQKVADGDVESPHATSKGHLKAVAVATKVLMWANGEVNALELADDPEWSWLLALIERAPEEEPEEPEAPEDTDADEEPEEEETPKPRRGKRGAAQRRRRGDDAPGINDDDYEPGMGCDDDDDVTPHRLCGRR